VVSERKCYFFGGQRVALRRDGMVQYIVGDHVGTTSLVLGAQGDKVAESRHFPYGGERWRWPEDSTFPTDYRFTGQRWEQPLGIYIMGARWYDSELGRWISPDTIIPDPANPQSWNRYSYVHNRPLTRTDPSGHITAEEEEEATTIITQLCDTFGICIEIDFGYVPYESPGPDDPVWMWVKGQWELRQLEALRNTVQYANELYWHYVEGEITALDFLAELTDYRASLGSLETFVDDISTVVLGDRGGQVWWRAFSHNVRWPAFALDDSGFSEFHQDNSNQVRHFWYYAHVAYTNSSGLARFGNWLHDRVDPGGTYQDWVLGNAGRGLGVGLQEGTVDFNEIGNWLRREAGEQNSLQ
jgi:RHS repeat-associated protein